MIETFFALLIGHALADFVLQSDAMAKGKNRHNRTTTPPGATCTLCWPYWLSSHALIHGGVVWAITSNVYLGAAETVVHWLIDFAKCENRINVHEDQFLHIACKVVWLARLR